VSVARSPRRSGGRKGEPMARWTFNEAHTAAEFSVRHMMITFVRGTFKNLQGTLEFDPDHPEDAWAETSIDAGTLWSGEPERDDHLRGEDFLDVARHPRIGFRSTRVEPVARNEYRVTGDLTIRGTIHPVTLDVRYLGQCRSPFDDTRIGFTATTRINRHDFGVSWNADLQDTGVVVGDDVFITIDVEAERPDEVPGADAP
jgi:polyisoprenoid-binding protein YceI